VGIAVLGLLTPMGYIRCCSGRGRDGTAMGAFLGCLLTLANMLLVCAALLGDDGDAAVSSGYDGETRGAFAVYCVCLAVVYAAFAAIAFLCKDVVAAEFEEEDALCYAGGQLGPGEAGPSHLHQQGSNSARSPSNSRRSPFAGPFEDYDEQRIERHQQKLRELHKQTSRIRQSSSTQTSQHDGQTTSVPSSVAHALAPMALRAVPNSVPTAALRTLSPKFMRSASFSEPIVVDRRPARREERTFDRSRTLEHLGGSSDKNRARKISRNRTSVPAGNEENCMGRSNDARGSGFSRQGSSFSRQGSSFSRHSYRPKVTHDDDDYHTLA